ncbi:lipid-A-disaccharide synthase [Defluviimonas sp. D31]|uniref:lipid-A-disaccharide synthase n=1 Tax=Defluviimonas sp. D31 TaxID=3083253 RepID=UPI00296F7E11|nr:lipid-A-disaccharide synthase [Defluviimonas sp. D31]MDW4548765.1 lipid-A-disaccharide synthase [Defluviimonas sp. D31]
MKIFLVAGEASGDALGAALMAGLKELAPGVAFHGVGGAKMETEGLESLFPMEDLSVMGLIEVLPKYRQLKRRIAETAEAVTRIRPDALVTIDSPDFCLRVVRAARAANPDIRTMHYVAPTVWAWRPGRAAAMAPIVDHVLALFPFEPPYMEAAGMTCDFVGHPVVAEPVAPADAAAKFRETHMIGPEQPLLLCLPGSRRGEVSRLAPRFEEAIARLRDREPALRVAIPTVRGVAALVREMAARWKVVPLVLDETADKRAAFAAADLALAASGTVSLELAANRVPMVIAYDFNRLTWWMMKRAALIDTATLVNIVTETRAIPEFLGPACQPGPIANALGRLIDDDEARAAQLAAMDATMDLLGRGGEAPGLRAARSVLAHL